MSATDIEALIAEGGRLQAAGDHPAALAVLHRALAQAQAAGDVARQPRCSVGIMQSYLQLAQYDLALQAALVTARLESDPSDPGGRWRAQCLLGLCYGLTGDEDNAERFTLAAYHGAGSAGMRNLQAACANNLVLMACIAADRLQRIARDAHARTVLEHVAPYLSHCEPPLEPEISYPRFAARANRGSWLRRVGRHDEAVAVLERVYPEALGRGWTDVARHASLDLGLIELAQGRPDAAVPWLVRCVAVGDGLDAYGWVGDAHLQLAAILQSRGEHAAAERHRAHNARLLDVLHAERRAAHNAVAAVAFDITRLLGDDTSVSSR